MGTSREFDTWKVQNEKLEIFSKENGAHAAYALVVIQLVKKRDQSGSLDAEQRTTCAFPPAQPE